MTPAVLIGISALFWGGLGPCHPKIPATDFQRDSFLGIGDGDSIDSSQATETSVIGALFLLHQLIRDHEMPPHFDGIKVDANLW